MKCLEEQKWFQDIIVMLKTSVLTDGTVDLGFQCDVMGNSMYSTLRFATWVRWSQSPRFKSHFSLSRSEIQHALFRILVGVFMVHLK